MTFLSAFSLLASFYPFSVGAWRWLTYEARTMETYPTLGKWAALPLLCLLPLALFEGKTEEEHFLLLQFWPLVVIILVTVDLYVISQTWRWFVAGPHFDSSVDLRGKTVIVTGANTGIGRETSCFLAEMGAHVIMACRSKARAEDAIKQILSQAAAGGKQIDPAQLEFMQLDVSSLQSVGDFVAAFQGNPRHHTHGLDILINNAGVMLNDKQLTVDGLEATMATNHYGHFLLTLLLFPELEKVADGRVVNVSSSLHKIPTSFNFDDPLYEVPDNKYTLFGAYAQSKLANVLFTVELQRRFAALQRDRRKIMGGLRGGGAAAGGRSLTANAVHPGNVQTEVTRNMPPLLYWGQKLCSPIFRAYQKTPPAGAYTTVHVATSPALRGVGGKYFVNSEATEDMSTLALDPALGERLWEISEEVCGLGGGGGGAGGGSPAKKAAVKGNNGKNGTNAGSSKSPARRRSTRRASMSPLK